VLPVEEEGESPRPRRYALKELWRNAKAVRTRQERSTDWIKVKTPHGREVEAKRFEHLRT
jgi:hypothetical protein